MIAIKQVTTQRELEAAIVIQLRVFCEEQGIPKSLCLEGNDDASHVLALERSRPVATARVIYRPDGDGELARVAVLPSHRKAGIGRALVLALEEIAVQNGVRCLTLKPHLHLEPFYAGLGYTRLNDAIDIVGSHELITMQKIVNF
jgi:predicted GNAT family N-acyltransferase